MSFSFYLCGPLRQKVVFETNLKFAYLLASETNLTDEDLPETFEYKISGAAHYRFKNWDQFSINAGLAYQRMMAFNLSKLASSQDLDQHNYDIGHLCVGGTYSYHGLWEIYSTLKLSYSSSFISSNDFDDQDVDSSIFLLEHFFQIEETRYYLFYESESSVLSGPDSDLERFGFGVRFLVF